MKKRILSLLCVLALCLGLLPVTALAEGTAPQTLYVGSTTISAGYWTSSDGGTTWACQKNQPEGNNYIYYDGQGTLKLHNVTIQRGSNTVSPPYGAGIYALCSSNQPVALTIELIGTNTITGYYGIYVNAEISADSNGTDASLTITSENNGSLEVSGLNYGIYVKSGTGNASLTINDASVVAKTTQTYSSFAGVYVQSSAHATSSPQLSLAVNGGSLTTSASKGNDGIQFYVGSSEATGATTRLTVSENAIVRAENGINAYRVDKPTPSGTGIVFNDKKGTVYDDVTLDESLTIAQGETLTIPEGSTLTVPEGKILTNNGTIDNSGTLTNNGTVTNNGTLNVNEGGKLEGETTGGSGTVVNTPTITAQPESQSVTERNTATFTVAATGEKLSYQWQQSTDSGQSWADIGGATDATYTTEATTTSMNGYQYRCVVSNSAGSITSDAVSLTVNEHVHTWGNPVWSWSEDGKTCTVTFTCEKDENHKESPKVDVTSAVKKPATCTETGVTTYTATVEFNGQTYTDTKEVADLPAIGHSYDNGKCTVCGAIASDFKVIITAGANGSWQKGTKDGLTFTSNAAYKHFQKVQVDGKDLDASNYTVKEGSTIVTLKAEYLETLSDGKHTLAIVSETGTATTEFTIKAAAVTDDTQSPQTGDDSNIALWIAVLLAAGTALTGTAVYSRKRKYSK